MDGGPDALWEREALPGREARGRDEGEGLAVGAGAFLTRTVLVLILGLPGANMTTAALVAGRREQCVGGQNRGSVAGWFRGE